MRNRDPLWKTQIAQNFGNSELCAVTTIVASHTGRVFAIMDNSSHDPQCKDKKSVFLTAFKSLLA